MTAYTSSCAPPIFRVRVRGIIANPQIAKVGVSIYIANYDDLYNQLSTIDIFLSTKEDFLSKKIEKIYNIGEDISIEITGANPKVKSQDAPRPLGTHKHNSIYIVCLFDITVITA